MLEKINSIFILGIKGVAMANLAVILKKMGKKVTGSDLKEEFITDKILKKHSISIKTGFSAKNLEKDTDLVIYSAAHGGLNNPLVCEAKKRNIAVISQAEVISLLMKRFPVSIAVSGCHGKTTTSSLLSYALVKLGCQPSYLVGTPSFNEYDGADYTNGDYFIVEADEYGVNPPDDLRVKFHFLDPDYIICTNIDFDHPDVYKNLSEVKKAFLRFFHNKKVIYCADDKNLFQCNITMKKNQWVSYGFNKKSDYVISNVKPHSAGSGFNLGNNSYNISLFGDKNVSNAAAVITMLTVLGFSQDKIRKSIQGFKGAKRRFEKVFENETFSLYDDYGHHPKEIEATIMAARNHFPSRRIIIIFQPHTYSRTFKFLKEFADALSKADFSFLLPIFPSAREDKKFFPVRSEDIIKEAKKNNLEYVANNSKLIDRLKKIIGRGDIIFTVGAGDVYKLKDIIISTFVKHKT